MKIDAPLPSDRKLGLLFSIAFGALAIYIWWRGSPRYPVAAVISALSLPTVQQTFLATPRSCPYKKDRATRGADHSRHQSLATDSEFYDSSRALTSPDTRTCRPLQLRKRYLSQLNATL
jgi:hypothetical protein